MVSTYYLRQLQTRLPTRQHLQPTKTVAVDPLPARRHWEGQLRGHHQWRVSQCDFPVQRQQQTLQERPTEPPCLYLLWTQVREESQCGENLKDEDCGSAQYGWQP